MGEEEENSALREYNEKYPSQFFMVELWWFKNQINLPIWVGSGEVIKCREYNICTIYH